MAKPALDLAAATRDEKLEPIDDLWGSLLPISEQRHQCVEQGQVRFGDAVVRQPSFTRRARAVLSGTPRSHPPP